MQGSSGSGCRLRPGIPGSAGVGYPLTLPFARWTLPSIPELCTPRESTQKARTGLPPKDHDQGGIIGGPWPGPAVCPRLPRPATTSAHSSLPSLLFSAQGLLWTPFPTQKSIQWNPHLPPSSIHNSFPSRLRPSPGGNFSSCHCPFPPPLTRRVPCDPSLAAHAAGPLGRAR